MGSSSQEHVLWLANFRILSVHSGSLFIILLLLLCVYMHDGDSVCYGVLVEIQGSFVETVFSFHLYIDSEGETQCLGLHDGHF